MHYRIPGSALATTRICQEQFLPSVLTRCTPQMCMGMPCLDKDAAPVRGLDSVFLGLCSQAIFVAF